MKASFYTLGCRLNEAETALVGRRFRAAGYDIVDVAERADVCVINTCTVTGEADAKCRQAIRKVLRRNPDTFVAVVGCYAEADADALRQIDGVDLIVGSRDKLRVLELMGEPSKRPEPEVHLKPPGREPFTIEGAAGRAPTTRANLKIQDGCDFMCSFCLIPFVRGRARSRAFSDIEREARELVAAGHQELVLTGVNVGTYRYEDRRFLDVVDMLCRIPDLARVRISSIEPTTIPDGLFERMAGEEALCPHLHIPLQSGSDRILHAMKRHHTRLDFLAVAEKAVETVPGLLLATDLIAGFPGETDADFEETLSILLDTQVSYAHIFRYSERAGTAAARLPDPVPPTTKKERSRRLHHASARAKQLRYAEEVGRTVRVLLETQDRQGRWCGFADNYVRVAIDPAPVRPLAENELVAVRVLSAPDTDAVRARPDHPSSGKMG